MNTEIIIKSLNALRAQNPLIHNITNYVVMNNTANALLAIGASPLMAHAEEEIDEIIAISSALVLNIGTLSQKWISSMLTAGKVANKKGIAIVFDPVGAGASSLRTETAKKIIEECRPDIIRGNGSEIMALANAAIKTKGVDSSAESNAALDSAKQLAEKYHCVASISGATDFITDGKRTIRIENGSPMMPKVTGLGCTATAITGAFAAIESDKLFAAVSAMAVMGIAGEIAEEKSAGPGSFQVNFLDALYTLSEKEILQRIKLIAE